MSKFKKIPCKCKVCNKPFSAYAPTDLCKQCAEKKRLSDLGISIPKRAIRNGDDKIDAILDRVHAFKKKGAFSMSAIKEMPIQNVTFIDSDGTHTICTAKIVDVSLDPIKIPETVGEVRSLNTTGALKLTLKNPKFSFRGLVRMLGFRMALRFKLRQIFQQRKEK